MERGTSTSVRPWFIAGAGIGALLIAIAIAAVVGFAENERVKNVVQESLRYDVAIEDRGDDLRSAVLDLRHFHRNIIFDGPSPAALADHDTAYAAVVDEIESLEALGPFERLTLGSSEFSGPHELRALADSYYTEFRDVLALRSSDPALFEVASDEGLERLASLEAAAQAIDVLGERLTAGSLTRVDEAVAIERIVLVGLLGGVALVGIVLAISGGRVLQRLSDSYAREQAVAQELSAVLSTKNDFIADASHELRTPLTVIRGNAEMGLATAGDPFHADVLKEIATAAARMSHLVDDLLFLARSDAGMPHLEPEYVPARWLVAQLAKPAEALALQYGTPLVTRIQAEGHLEVDPMRIEQAVLILIDNAAKNSPPNGSITLSSIITPGNLLVIEVADEGPGIPPEELPLIFERFYQVGNRRTRKQGGSGLGLSIARTIVHAHNGTIAVDSTVGRGTRVLIRLPLAASPGSPVNDR